MVPLMEVEIAFPTGELIITDWVQESQPVLMPYFTRESINTLDGRIALTNSMASANVLHMFVGNTSPDVFKKGDKLILEQCDPNTEEPMDTSFEKIAHISTDLWWATIIDRAVINSLYQSHYDTTIEYPFDTCPTRVKPGIYKCQYYGTSEDRPHIFVTLMWDRDIEPLEITS